MSKTTDVKNSIRPQTLDRVIFQHLKGINNLDIDFSGKQITAIFGINGCGKSTILHALACLYRPLSDIGEKNYFTRFFKKENQETWEGSKLVAYFTYNGTKSERMYGKASDRWTPRINKRLQRDVVYLGITSCVPDIEQATTTLSKYSMGPEEDVKSQEKIVSAAKFIMNYSYENYKKTTFRKKKYKKITRETTLRYSSLAMGAGEQRLFFLLEVLYSLQPYSLLLIDELDLTLHTSALMKLMDKMAEIAGERHLQIVFTTHREELTQRTDINIRHIWNISNENKTFILNNTTPECLRRLTGKNKKTLEIYVEDDLAEYVAREVVRKNGLLPYTSFFRFGAIDNAFVIAAGLEMQKTNTENKIIILDGDRYTTPETRMERMKKIFSGTEENIEVRRKQALSIIRQYTLPENRQPEHFLWEKLKESNSEFAEFAREIIEKKDKHDYLKEVEQQSGEERTDFLKSLMTSLSHECFWDTYVEELTEWIIARKRGIYAQEDKAADKDTED